MNDSCAGRIAALLCRGQAFPAAIMEIQESIHAHHGKIDAIKHEHDVPAVKQLVRDACDIADQDDDEEQHALSLRSFRAQRFDDVQRPGKPETDEHDRFKKTDFAHHKITVRPGTQCRFRLPAR